MQSDFGNRWQDAIIERICLKIYESSGSLIEEFRKYDKDGNGSVEYNEFVEAMRKLELGLTNEQLYELMRSIDTGTPKEAVNNTDRSNSIDFEEFIHMFQESWVKIKKEKDEEYVQKTMKEIDEYLTEKGKKNVSWK